MFFNFHFFLLSTTLILTWMLTISENNVIAYLIFFSLKRMHLLFQNWVSFWLSVWYLCLSLSITTISLYISSSTRILFQPLPEGYWPCAISIYELKSSLISVYFSIILSCFCFVCSDFSGPISNNTRISYSDILFHIHHLF